MDQKVEISLLQRYFTAYLSSFHECVFKLQLRPKANTIPKPVAKKQYEAMEVEGRWIQTVMVVRWVSMYPAYGTF
jgi:hypothetical protein